MLAEISLPELAAALDLAAAEVLAEAGILRPPVDAFAVARALRLVVAVDGRQSGRARYVRLGTQPERGEQGSILVRPDPRQERQQWAVAHELGEHLAPQLYRRLGIEARTAPPGLREELANRFAAHLLLPRAWFEAAGRRHDGDLFRWKASFSTASHELIARRMLDLDMPVVVTVFDQGRVTWRRGNLPGRVPPVTPLERECQRQTSAGEPGVDRSTSELRVRAWAIHEAGWRREIVRTDVLSPVDAACD